jgi:hypothetical protein
VLPFRAETCGWVVRDRYLGKIAGHRDRVLWIELRIESYAFSAQVATEISIQRCQSPSIQSPQQLTPPGGTA